MTGHDAISVYRNLLQDIGLSEDAVGGSVAITGADPIVPSRHRLGAATAGALATQGAAIAAIWKLRTGRTQNVSVNVRRAVVPGLQTAFHLYQNGCHVAPHPRGADPTNFFATKDGRRIYLLRTTVYPDILTRLFDVLQCGYESAAMARAVSAWNAFELEEALAERRAVGVVARTRVEWLRHPQGAWLAERPPVEIEKIGESTPEPLRPASRPLAGVRVLDATHVLAGPVTTRVLAEQGADVLHVTPPFRLDIHPMVIDTGFGKRTAYADLEKTEDAARLVALVEAGDVFVQSWRPGVLDKFGLSPAALARRRPGIIYVSVSCYGSGGPWQHRGGFEPIGQTASGLAVAEGSLEHPKLAVTGTLNDYLAAYLGAAGILGALLRRALEGGSYHVKVSLTRTSMFVQELGELTPGEASGAPAAIPGPEPSDFVEYESGFGRLCVPAPLVQYSDTPAHWNAAPAPVGRDSLEWLR